MDLARNLIQRINVGDSLTRSAAARPAQLAVVDGPRRWTYAEFNAWVNRLAHGLAARGYQRGDALGLASANSAEFLAVYYACAKLGLVCVPINLGWRPDEVAYVLDHSGARGLVAETQLVGHVRDAVAEGAGPRRRLRGAGHGCCLRGGARRPLLGQPGGPGRRRQVRGGPGVLRGRPGRDQLPLYLRHHILSQRRGGHARGDLPGVDVQRAGFRLERRRPVRGHDAHVPHRPAERVLHARHHGGRHHPCAARLRPGSSCWTWSSGSRSPRCSGCR